MYADQNGTEGRTPKIDRKQGGGGGKRRGETVAGVILLGAGKREEEYPRWHTIGRLEDPKRIQRPSDFLGVVGNTYLTKNLKEPPDAWSRAKVQKREGTVPRDRKSQKSRTNHLATPTVGGDRGGSENGRYQDCTQGIQRETISWGGFLRGSFERGGFKD